MKTEAPCNCPCHRGDTTTPAAVAVVTVLCASSMQPVALCLGCLLAVVACLQALSKPAQPAGNAADCPIFGSDDLTVQAAVLQMMRYASEKP
jgi:hypothetical protein